MKRLFAISDIHGCLSEIKLMLKLIKLTKNDRLVILGDNIDRGPYSIEVVLEIKKLKDEGYDIITLKGNHEEMLIDSLKEFESMEDVNNSYLKSNLIHNGTYGTLEKYFSASPESKAAFLTEISNYKLTHIEDNYLFVHAGVCPNLSFEKQSEDCLLWIRDEFIHSRHNLPYIVVFGHTPTRFLDYKGKDVIWINDDKIGIDCACVKKGVLGCIDLVNMQEYYVEYKREPSKL